MVTESPAEGEMTETLWLTELVPPLYYQENVCFKTLLIESSCTEAFARVSKKGIHVILPISSAPNGLLRAFYETISEVNRITVPQTDSKIISSERFKKTQPNNQKKVKEDEWFFKRERAIPAPWCHKQP